MNKTLLKKHIHDFVLRAKKDPDKFNSDFKERLEHVSFYKSYDEEKILSMNEEEIYKYLSGLWAMLIWGNKHYAVDKIITENGSQNFKKRLAELVWGKAKIEERWDKFRTNIKGMGPAMISEILCKTHPENFMIWNRRAYVGLNYLEVKDLPIYDYQVNGKRYKYLCDVCIEIADNLKSAEFDDTTLLAVDYFIWDELQVEDNLSKIGVKPKGKTAPTKVSSEESKFLHDDIKDKLRNIGEWLGFDAKIEQKVADGAKVDTIWEATIGNMGRVIYIFEVQTKGSIDSLIVNLLKSLNNPAVQGVVAVSDREQLEKIKKHAADVKDLKERLKYWEYEEILKVHECLEFTNSCINNLGLVPTGY